MFEGIGWFAILVVGMVIGLLMGFLIAFVVVRKELPTKIAAEREDAKKRSRSVRLGNELEKFVPFLNDFQFEPRDCWFLGKPIDFIVFEGLGEDKVHDVVFVEVKTGKGRLSTRQRAIRDAVENRRVRWHEHRVGS